MSLASQLFLQKTSIQQFLLLKKAKNKVLEIFKFNYLYLDFNIYGRNNNIISQYILPRIGKGFV